MWHDAVHLVPHVPCVFALLVRAPCQWNVALIVSLRLLYHHILIHQLLARLHVKQSTHLLV